MYILLIIVGIISILAGESNAQLTPGARQIALSNSDVALCSDAFAIYTNPGGTAQINSRQFGIYYSPAPFGLKELANGFMVYNEPFKWGSAGVGAMTYGFDLYKETKFTAAISYKFKNYIYIGGTLNYHLISIKNYGSDNAIYFNFGSLLFITNEIRWAFTLTNLNNSTFSKQGGQIPMTANTGFAYSPFEDLSLCAGLEKDPVYPVSFSAGVELKLNKNIFLRSGFANNPTKYSAGVGICFQGVELDYALFTHNYLGLTHQAGIIINLSDKDE